MEFLFKDFYAGGLRTVSGDVIYTLETCGLYRNISTTDVPIILTALRFS